MATRTISNAGGTWSATGTWVEGSVPTNADDVVATATSGNVTVNALSNVLSINLTNYGATMTFNGGNINIANNGSITLPAGTKISATTFNLTNTSNNNNLFAPQGNCTITIGDGVRPNIRFIQVGTLTFTNAVTEIGNLQIQGGSTITLAANKQLNIYNGLHNANTATNPTTTGCTFAFIGNVSFAGTETYPVAYVFGSTFSLSGSLYLRPSTGRSNIDVVWQSGNITGMNFLVGNGLNASGTTTFNLQGNTCSVLSNYGSANTTRVVFASPFVSSRIDTDTAGTAKTYLLTGSSFSTGIFRITNTGSTVQIGCTGTSVISNFISSASGFGDAVNTISSQTASVPIRLNVNSAQLINTSLTDIDCSAGNQVRTLYGTLTRTTNVMTFNKVRNTMSTININN